jgi:hypothetical protein
MGPNMGELVTGPEPASCSSKDTAANDPESISLELEMYFHFILQAQI